MTHEQPERGDNKTHKLAKAFRSESVPQDPRDEPASELPARIRTTRELNVATKRNPKKSIATKMDQIYGQETAQI